MKNPRSRNIVYANFPDDIRNELEYAGKILLKYKINKSMFKKNSGDLRVNIREAEKEFNDVISRLTRILEFMEKHK